MRQQTGVPGKPLSNLFRNPERTEQQSRHQ
jgi:hypothetical protein